MSHLTIPEFQQHKQQEKKLTVVTAYDALFTRIVEQAGLEVILVGDSLGMVVQGKPNTLSVTMEEMLYHTRLVAQGGETGTGDWRHALSVLSGQCGRGRTKCRALSSSGRGSGQDRGRHACN